MGCGVLNMSKGGKNIIQFSRKKGTIALLATSYVSIALVIVKNIVMVPLYLSYIDNRLYGAWLATGSIIAYFGLLDFGLNGVLVQRVASNYGKKNFERLGNILGIGLMISLALSCIPLLFGFLLSSWLPGIVHIAGVEAQQLKTAFICASIGTSMMLAMYCVGGALIALQCQMFHGIILVAGNILELLTIIVLLEKGVGIVAIPAGTIVWGGIALLGDGTYLWLFMKRNKLRLSFVFKADIIKDLFLQSIWQFGARSASAVAKQSDNLIVGVLLDPISCVVLTMTKKASDLLTMLVGHMAGAFLPSLAHLHGEDVNEKFKKITLMLYKITSLLGICFMVGYLFFNRHFVNLWVGADNFGGELLTALFCVYALFLILTNTFYNVIFSKGEMITVAQANISGAIISILLSIIMVQAWGIKGVAIAAIIAIMPTNFFMQGRKFIAVLKLSKPEILKLVKILIIQILLSYAIGLIFSNLYIPHNFISLIIIGICYLMTALFCGVIADRSLCSEAMVFLRHLKRRFFSARIFLR
jgi:O-antigen/teichoic acid export membrane protein